MKIIVLHGDNERSLYERLTKFISSARSRSWEISYLDDPKYSIREQLSSSSLFGAERFFIIRDIKRLGKTDLTWLTKKSEDLKGNLVIYHEGYIPQAILKLLPKDLKIEEFKLPVLLWNFLDSIEPGNSTKILKQFHKIIEKQAPEFIFTLLSKLFRDLYWVKSDATSLPYPNWRVGKLKAQSVGFSVDQLKNLIEKLAAIDIKVKTSKSDLTNELDLFIIKHLELS